MRFTLLILTGLLLVACGPSFEETVFEPGSIGDLCKKAGATTNTQCLAYIKSHGSSTQPPSSRQCYTVMEQNTFDKKYRPRTVCP